MEAVNYHVNQKLEMPGNKLLAFCRKKNDVDSNFVKIIAEKTVLGTPYNFMGAASLFQRQEVHFVLCRYNEPGMRAKYMNFKL